MIYFIINEKARTGKGVDVWEKVQEFVEEAGIKYVAYKTMYQRHATLLAKEVCRKEDDDICLVVVGGDGTMNEVINGITDFDKIRFGIIPAGSGNDFARGLGFDKDVWNNWERISKAVEAGKNSYKEMDIGQVEWTGCKKPRLFGISSGVGLDAIVCKKAIDSPVKKFLNKLHLGKLTYIILTIQTLFTMDTAQAEMSFAEKKDAEDKEKVVEKRQIEKMIFSAAMNLRAEGGGVPMAPRADAFDGKMSLCSAYGIPKWRTFLCLPLLTAAKHEKLKGFNVTDSAVVKLKLSKPMTIHADGEYLGEAERVRFSCADKKLKVMM